MDKKEIEFNRIFKTIRNNCRSEIHRDRCAYCNCHVEGFCNSHSIPQFVLRNIAANGHLYYSGHFINLFDNGELGLKNAGTFRMLCKKCDGLIFQDYENPDNLQNKPNDLMMAEIAFKNYLKYIYKREVDPVLYGKIPPEILVPKYKAYLDVSILDVRDLFYWYLQTKQKLQKRKNLSFHLFCYEKLDYVVPLAFQSPISLHVDLNKEPIGNLFDHSPQRITQQIHVSVYPMKDYTIVLAFRDMQAKDYLKFANQFQKLSQEEKLKYLNFFIFRYTEDYYLAPTFSLAKEKLDLLTKTAQKLDEFQYEVGNTKQHDAIIHSLYENMYDDLDKIPNLLSPDNQLSNN